MQADDDATEVTATESRWLAEKLTHCPDGNAAPLLEALGLTDQGRTNAAGIAVARELLRRWEMPYYDEGTGILTFRGREIKRLERSAPYQRTILEAFQEAGWPPCIDNPLKKAGARDDPVQRLRRAVESLNKTQVPLTVRFRITGGRVRWCLVSPAEYSA